MSVDSRWGEAKWGATSQQPGAGDEMPWGDGAAPGDVIDIAVNANKVAIGPALGGIPKKGR